jgi:histidinol-phosphate phosphatase family protein
MSESSATPKQLVVLAGGMGTRLAAVTGGLPKALVPVGGKPVVELQVELAVRYGIERVLLLLGHGAEDVVAWTRTWAGPRVDFSWQIEQQPRGTGGAILDALRHLDERFVLFFADQLLDFDVGRLAEHHAAAANDVTVVVHPNDHPHDSDLLAVDAAGRVTALHRPPHAGKLIRNVVNAATYVIDRRSLEPLRVPEGVRADLARDLLPQMIASGTQVGAYRSREYLKDMGTPERLAKVEADLASGVVAGRRAERPMPAILLDRDGTINVERGRITRPDDIELIAGVADSIKRAHAKGHLVAVVTNQPVVARGDCTFEELDAIHARLEMLLADSRAYVDAIYVCPHHPDRGFAGEVSNLKGPCRCRKPATGLVDDAARDLNLDISATWLIGDSSSDVACALEAGLIPAVVSTGHGGNDGRHSTELALRFPTAADAIDFAIEDFPAVWQRCLAAVSDCNDGASIQAIGDSPEAADNVARLLALAAMRLGKTVSMRLLTRLHETGSPGVAKSSDEITVTAALSTAAVTGTTIEVAP